VCTPLAATVGLAVALLVLFVSTGTAAHEGPTSAPMDDAVLAAVKAELRAQFPPAYSSTLVLDPSTVAITQVEPSAFSVTFKAKSYIGAKVLRKTLSFVARVDLNENKTHLTVEGEELHGHHHTTA